MTQGLGIEHVIDINTEISSSGIGAADFGTGLLFTAVERGNYNNASNELSAHGTKKIFKLTKFDQIYNFFDGSDAAPDDHKQIIKDVSVWFSSNPEPKSLYIAKIAKTTFPTALYTDELTSDDLDTVGAANHGWSISINNTTITVSAADQSSKITTWTNFAAILQGLMQGKSTTPGFAGATVEAVTSGTNTRLKIVFAGKGSVKAYYDEPTIQRPDTGTANIFWSDDPQEGYYGANNAAKTGGAYYNIGNESVETLKGALEEVSAYATGGHPTALMLGTDVLDAQLGTGQAISELRDLPDGDYISAFVENVNFANSSAEKPAGDAQVTSNEGNTNCIGIHSKPIDGETSLQRSDIAVLSKLSSQDFNQPDSIITLVPKPLEGVQPIGASSAEIKKLEAVNASVYTTVGGYPTFLGGKVGAGYWVDAQWWLTWLKSEMESNIFKSLRSSKRLKNIELTDTIHQVMAKALRTGGIQLGGKLNLTLTNEVRRVLNNPGFDGVLQNGYVLWIQNTQNLTDVDRNARHARFKVWISPSEAIHSVSGGIVLSG